MLKSDKLVIIEEQLPSLEALSLYYGKLEKILEERKQFKDNFTYEIEPDYDDLTITIKFKFQVDDNPEGNPQLN